MAPPSHNSHASDTVLPASPLPTDPRTRQHALDSQELHEATLDDPAQHLVDVLVDRPPDQKAVAADDPDNPANNLQYPEGHPAASIDHQDEHHDHPPESQDGGASVDSEAAAAAEAAVAAEANAAAVAAEADAQAGVAAATAAQVEAAAAAVAANVEVAAVTAEVEVAAAAAAAQAHAAASAAVSRLGASATAENVPGTAVLEAGPVPDDAAVSPSSRAEMISPKIERPEPAPPAKKAKVQASISAPSTAAVPAAGLGVVDGVGLAGPGATVVAHSMPLGAGLVHAAAAYQFPTLAPNGAALMPHGMVPVPTPAPVGRRAVRIAPMGVLPLPPQGGGSGAGLMADLPGGSVGLLGSLAAANVVAEGGADNGSGVGVVSGMGMGGMHGIGGVGGVGGMGGMGGLGGLGGLGGAAGAGVGSGEVSGRIGEMRKGKRRGTPGTVSGLVAEGLTAEERTKQKRMLRNRESAARSRDKRKSRNMRLENSIKQVTVRKEAVEVCLAELAAVVAEMRTVVEKDKGEIGE